MLSRVLKFVEIQTKITSAFPFFMVLAYLFAIGQPIRWDRTLVFFGSMFLIDLATTAINNFMDTRTNGLPLTVSRRAGLVILLALALGGAALGLLLVAMTDAVVLVAGAVCFLCGVLYTSGPVPLNHTPLGEVLSGLFYGLAIPFLLLYISLPQGTLLTLEYSWQTVGFELQVLPFVTLLLLSVLPVCATANIMLANNICDLERDVSVKRYTLPFFLGKKNALLLFAALTYGGYFSTMLLVLMGALPVIYLLLLLTAIPVTKNLRVFFRKQDKETTFPMAIMNYILTMSANVVLILASHWFLN